MKLFIFLILQVFFIHCFGQGLTKIKQTCDSLKIVNKRNYALILIHEPDSITNKVTKVHSLNKEALTKVSKVRKGLTKLYKKDASQVNKTRFVLNYLNKEFDGSIFQYLNRHVAVLIKVMHKNTPPSPFPIEKEFEENFEALSYKEKLEWLSLTKYQLMFIESIFLSHECGHNDCIQSKIAVKFKQLDRSLQEYTDESNTKTEELLKKIAAKVEERGNQSDDYEALIQAERLEQMSDSLINDIAILKEKMSDADSSSGVELKSKLNNYIQSLESISNKVDYMRNRKYTHDQLLESSKQVHLKSTELINYIEDLKVELIELSGGSDKNNTPRNIKNTSAVDELFLGDSLKGTKKGNELVARLNKHISFINTVYNEIIITEGKEPDLHHYKKLALSGNEDPLFKDRPNYKNKSFLELNFHRTPMIAALAFLTEKQAKIANYEAEILSLTKSLIDK